MPTILNWLTRDELGIQAYGTPVGARKGWDTRGYALADKGAGRDGKEVLMQNGFRPKKYGETHGHDAMPGRYFQNYEVFEHPSGAHAMVRHHAETGNDMVVKSMDPELLDKIDQSLKEKMHGNDSRLVSAG